MEKVLWSNILIHITFHCFLKVYVHVCGRVHAHVSEGGHGVQKRALDPWELDLQAVVSHPILVLGKELT